MTQAEAARDPWSFEDFDQSVRFEGLAMEDRSIAEQIDALLFGEDPQADETGEEEGGQ